MRDHIEQLGPPTARQLSLLNDLGIQDIEEIRTGTFKQANQALTEIKFKILKRFPVGSTIIDANGETVGVILEYKVDHRTGEVESLMIRKPNGKISYRAIFPLKDATAKLEVKMNDSDQLLVQLGEQITRIAKNYFSTLQKSVDPTLDVPKAVKAIIKFMKSRRGSFDLYNSAGFSDEVILELVQGWTEKNIK